MKKGVLLSGEIKSWYGHSRCIRKTNAKLAINTERESNAEAKFRKTLSFSVFQFRVMGYEFAIANVMI